MNVTLDFGALLDRRGGRHRSGGRASVSRPPWVTALAPVERDADACDRVLRELAGAALLVERGVAKRVVVCNAPAAIDLDEVRLLADTFDVIVEPIVRVGGGGLDFAVRPGTHEGQ